VIPGFLLAAAVAGGALTADLPDDVLAAVAGKKATRPDEVLAAVMSAVRPYVFEAGGVHALTDRRWFQADSAEGPGAPVLEIRRWPGDTIVAFYALCGEGLCIGYDGGDAVSSAYAPKFEWSGGEIVKVVFDVADDAYIDIESHLAAAVARD